MCFEEIFRNIIEFQPTPRSKNNHLQPYKFCVGLWLIKLQILAGWATSLRKPGWQDAVSLRIARGKVWTGFVLICGAWAQQKASKEMRSGNQMTCAQFEAFSAPNHCSPLPLEDPCWCWDFPPCHCGISMCSRDERYQVLSCWSSTDNDWPLPDATRVPGTHTGESTFWKSNTEMDGNGMSLFLSKNIASIDDGSQCQAFSNARFWVNWIDLTIS